MGLDMYAYTAPANLFERDVDFDIDIFPAEARLHYWRKHPDLHGWMEELYYAKGGSSENFNRVPVALTSSDLDELELAIRRNALPITQGFFFGKSDGSEAEDDLAFIEKARKAIADELDVFYTSCW
ncbi:hypothetical protein SAMN06295912_12825 [Sphingomonas laterariae]|uniref:Uncharacterized protein n=1 Tax=Edaphosphingomonas laterariae TaxID=861865 RepID=A0A239J1M7_9SPHN|nr:phosphoglycerate kinase [Sphingomonas laterariae]SNS98554.1 hypothetical protein SAMN06295912_12825 [Sphingomonas laterariae]